MVLLQTPALIQQNSPKESAEVSRIRSILIDEKEAETGREQMRKALIQKVKDGIFAVVVGGKNINRFVDRNGKTIFAIEALSEDSAFARTSEHAGYKEIKTPTGIYELYRLTDMQYGSPKPGAKPVDKFSEEYFEFWSGQLFYQDRDWIDNEKQLTADTNRYLPIDDRTLRNMSTHGALTIRDLLDYFVNAQINEILLRKYVAKIIPQLTWQTRDTNGRFKKGNCHIRNEDIDFWSHPDLTIQRKTRVKGKEKITEIKLGALISPELAKECKKIISEREAKVAEKKEQISQISDATRLQTAKLSASLGEAVNANPVINLTYRTKYQTDKILSA